MLCCSLRFGQYEHISKPFSLRRCIRCGVNTRGLNSVDSSKCEVSMLLRNTHLNIMETMMRHGDRKQVTADDGSIYEVEALRLPSAGTVNVLVVTGEMQAVAISLLPIAQRMAKSRATRAFFYKTSERRLEAFGERGFLQAEEASREANKYAQTLALVAEGVSIKGDQRVTLRTWQEVMAVFHQNKTRNIDG